MAVISSHTLNGIDGSHAGGIAVTLLNIENGTQLFSTTMDEGGRLQETVDISSGKPTDRYELVMQTGAYWTDKGVRHTDLIDEIVLRFKMPDPDARYHMPIILSPNSYSTWASAAVR